MTEWRAAKWSLVWGTYRAFELIFVGALCLPLQIVLIIIAPRLAKRLSERLKDLAIAMERDLDQRLNRLRRADAQFKALRRIDP